MLFLVETIVNSTPLFSTGDIIAIGTIVISTLIIVIQARGQTMKDIRNGIIRIEKFLISKFADAANIFITGNSPISLTDTGKKLLDDGGGKNLIDSNLEFFIIELNNTSPKTALDVENNAFEVIFKNSDADMFKGIKDFIYNNPNYGGVSVNLTTIVKICSIYLRDKYFDKYPNILQESGSI